MITIIHAKFTVRVLQHDKGQFRYLAPLSGLSRMKYSQNCDYDPVSGIWLNSNRPCLLQNGWLRAFTNMFVFRNVQLTEWLMVFVDVPNQVS